MKKRDTFIRRGNATLAFAIIALMAMGTVGGCAAWWGSCALDSGDYRLDIKSGYNGTDRGDSLFTTLEDSVLIIVQTPPYTWALTKPGRMKLEYSIDFGDGTHTSNPKWDSSNFEIKHIEMKHLYKQKGVYHLRVWGTCDDMVISGDSVYVVVKDYVYPLEATKINISVTGIERNVFHLIERPGQRDSSYLTTEKDFAYSIDTHGDTEFYWNAFRGLSIQEFAGMLPNGQKQWTYIGPLSILADGSALYSVRLSHTEYTTLENSTREVQTFIAIRELPLKKGSTPTRQHAVYEATFPADTRWASDVTRWPYDPSERIYHDFKIQSGDTTHSAKTFHDSAYSDITITVEFTTE